MVLQKIWDALVSDGFNLPVLFCFLIGAYEGLVVLQMFLTLIYRYALRSEINFKKYGKWAVVTGATDGIGKAYCEELAARGLNVFLLSRTESKLIEASKEISSKYGVETNHMAVDFSKVPKEMWVAIREQMDKLDVGILVNNVGCSYEHYEFLHLISSETVDQLLELNVRSTTEMTRAVLPGMVDRKRGIVVCIGSGVGSLLPSSPLLAAYAGTKAYIEQFVKCCSVEYRDKNIIFQDQAPLFVATKMSKIRKETLSVPSPNNWVASAIRGVGFETLTPGYWFHSLMWPFVTAVPSRISEGYFFILAKSLRARALRKKQGGGTKKTS
ncbi:hypothetical protein BSKO_14112 [Bryopsis sp. KO-2023]|nr:hypothetical protein BSKO_14112 [Bryopsis sp. KO-2023]